MSTYHFVPVYVDIPTHIVPVYAANTSHLCECHTFLLLLLTYPHMWPAYVDIPLNHDHVSEEINLPFYLVTVYVDLHKRHNPRLI